MSKKVIADMFGMALRTYHRRVRELHASRTDSGSTLWEAVLSELREHQPLSVREVQRRFRRDDPQILIGVLNDLVASGLVYRAGRAEGAVFRVADAADFVEDADSRSEANQYLVWLAVYRDGPLDLARAAELTRLTAEDCRVALAALTGDGRVRVAGEGEHAQYHSTEFDVPFGTTQGWETAVLDHFQALVSAISAKLRFGSGALATGGHRRRLDVVARPVGRPPAGTRGSRHAQRACAPSSMTSGAASTVTALQVYRAASASESSTTSASTCARKTRLTTVRRDLRVEDRQRTAELKAAASPRPRSARSARGSRRRVALRRARGAALSSDRRS